MRPWWSGAFLYPGQPVIHDRDTKYCSTFQETLKSAGVTPLTHPPHCPKLNAHAERWVRSVKEEVLSRHILFGEDALRQVLNEYGTHYHQERPHQGKNNELLLPRVRKEGWDTNPIHARERFGWTAEILPSGGRLSFLTIRGFYSQLKRGNHDWQCLVWLINSSMSMRMN